MPQSSETRRELWVLGIKPGDGREEIIFSYLAAGGYACRFEQFDNIEKGKLWELCSTYRRFLKMVGGCS